MVNKIKIGQDMSGYSRIDIYDWELDTEVVGEYRASILVPISSNRDVTLTDILSDIDSHNGKIFADGKYYKYLTSFTKQDEKTGQQYLQLVVEEEV